MSCCRMTVNGPNSAASNVARLAGVPFTMNLGNNVSQLKDKDLSGLTVSVQICFRKYTDRTLGC